MMWRLICELLDIKAQIVELLARLGHVILYVLEDEAETLAFLDRILGYFMIGVVADG